MTLFLNMRYITFLFPLIMGTSSFLLYIIFIIIVQYLTMFNSCASIFNSLSVAKFYIGTFLVTSINFLCDYLIESIKMNFSNQISTNLLKTILKVNKENDIMKSFVQTRKKYSETFQINNLQNKVLSRLSVFSGSQSDNYMEFDNSSEDTLKKAKSSEFRLNYSKDKHDFKNFSETMFEGKGKNDNSIIDDTKKDNLYNPNEKWMSTSKIKIDSNNKIINIPHFQLK